jgi:hypothetical protein
LRGIPLGISVTDLEIEESIREAWAALPAASPSARRLAAALLAVTGGTQTHPHWITPDDLWRDRLAVLADQGAWLVSWGPRPGEPGCQAPPALLPESQIRRENAYAVDRRPSLDRDRATPSALNYFTNSLHEVALYRRRWRVILRALFPRKINSLSRPSSWPKLGRRSTFLISRSSAPGGWKAILSKALESQKATIREGTIMKNVKRFK